MPIIKTTQELGEFIRQRRKECRATQEQISDFANVSHNGLSQLETGQKSPQFDTILKLTKWLGFKIVLVREEDAGPTATTKFIVARSPKSRKQADTYYRKTYGISLEQYEEMLGSQSGRCKLCDRLPARHEKRLAVDHDHRTGAIRGLLCAKCNLALGAYERSIARIHPDALKDYLK